MNWNLLGNFLVAGFLIGPGAVLLIRFFKGRRFRWWIAIALSLVVGWVCILGASLSSTEQLEAEMQAYEARGADVPDDLMEARASDAHSVFALFFSWAFTLPVVCSWLIVYAIAHRIRASTESRSGNR